MLSASACLAVLALSCAAGTANAVVDSGSDTTVSAQLGVTSQLTLTVTRLPDGQFQLTGTVAQSAYAASAPTGDIYFYDGASLLGHTTLSTLAANWQGALPGGTDSITARYPGNPPYSAATSPVVVLTVSTPTATPTPPPAPTATPSSTPVAENPTASASVSGPVTAPSSRFNPWATETGQPNPGSGSGSGSAVVVPVPSSGPGQSGGTQPTSTVRVFGWLAVIAALVTALLTLLWRARRVWQTRRRPIDIYRSYSLARARRRSAQLYWLAQGYPGRPPTSRWHFRLRDH
jgi:hypothetical protein